MNRSPRSGAAKSVPKHSKAVDSTIRRIGVRISRDAMDRLKAEAIRRGQSRLGHVSLSELINEAILAQIPDLEVEVRQRRA